ncbi:hypothetical protein M9H77_02935 [Catharanthus roseus]|uniref:Uncharacterized protein n=1 Tax=Catharanthus roseus TaxID=4058 RepID=A0ACC0C9Z1_CATRO|nr:hypothetical protein M9H77_02935 [Catharanthus roseus]
MLGYYYIYLTWNTEGASIPIACRGVCRMDTSRGQSVQSSASTTNNQNIEEELESLFFLCSRRSFAFTCQVLLEIIHRVPPLVNIISNVGHLSWLFEGTDSRTNPFQMRGSVTRSRARKIDLKMQRNKL